MPALAPPDLLLPPPRLTLSPFLPQPSKSHFSAFPPLCDLLQVELTDDGLFWVFGIGEERSEIFVVVDAPRDAESGVGDDLEEGRP